MSSKISTYRGVELKSDDLAKHALIEDSARLTYSWSSGVAIGRFLEGLMKGEIWGRECDGCGRIVVPPRVYCELCFRANDRWVRLKDTGKVTTYSISHINTDATRRDQPIIIGVIGIDGASELMGILHLLGEASPREVSIGMAVKAVWRPAEERKGSITDIRYFKPLAARG